VGDGHDSSERRTSHRPGFLTCRRSIKRSQSILNWQRANSIWTKVAAEHATRSHDGLLRSLRIGQIDPVTTVRGHEGCLHSQCLRFAHCWRQEPDQPRLARELHPPFRLRTVVTNRHHHPGFRSGPVESGATMCLLDQSHRRSRKNCHGIGRPTIATDGESCNRCVRTSRINRSPPVKTNRPVRRGNRVQRLDPAMIRAKTCRDPFPSTCVLMLDMIAVGVPNRQRREFVAFMFGNAVSGS